VFVAINTERVTTSYKELHRFHSFFKMVLSQEVEIVFQIIFAVLIVIDIAGNGLVCLVVRRFPFMKTPMNYLLVHLAICDMLVGMFLFPRHVFLGLYDHPSGLVGDLLCKFLTYGIMAWLPSCASVYTLLAIAWERYNAIMKPLKRRLSKKKIRYAIVLSWVLGFFICLPETVAIAYNPKIKSCDFFWINGTSGAKVDSGLWLFAIGTFPFLIMLVLYGSVVRTLWCCGHGADDVAQRSLQLSRKRITKTAVTVTVILFVCWMPNLLYYFILSMTPQDSSPAADLKSAAPVFYPITHLFILLNSSINPFIYALQYTRFRRCMSLLLCGRLSTGDRLSRHNFQRQAGKHSSVQLEQQHQKQQQSNNNEY